MQPDTWRLRELHPLTDNTGALTLLYDLERTFVIPVPLELRSAVAVALESQHFCDESLEWLRSEDLLTRSERRSWKDLDATSVPAVTDVSLDLAGACNMGCGYCFEKDIDSRLGPMDARTATETINFAFRKSQRSPRVALHFGSGEPLLRFRLLQSVVAQAEETATRLGKSVTFDLTTNGTLVTEEIARFLASHPFHVRLSCDGPAAVHNRFRPMLNGRDSYARVETGLRVLLEFIPDKLTVNSVLCGPTPLSALWEWAKSLGLRHYHVIKVGTYEDSEHDMHQADLAQYRDDLQAISHDLISELRAARQPIDFQPLTKVVRRLMVPQPITRFCGVAGSYLGVASNGKIYPCFRHIGLKRYELGSVFQDCNDQKRAAFRRSEAAEVDSRPICSSCWARYLCGGGCYADSVVYGPDPHKPQVQHCPFWQAEIEAAVQLFAYLSEERPADCLRLFGDDVADMLEGPPVHARFQARLNCS